MEINAPPAHNFFLQSAYGSELRRQLLAVDGLRRCCNMMTTYQDKCKIYSVDDNIDANHNNGKTGGDNHDDVIKWKHFPRYWPLCGEFTGPGEFPAQRPVTRCFDVCFDLCLNNGWVNNR